MSLALPEKPTLYFIGVTTGSSSIMKVFPKWSEIMGLGAQIVGYDAPLNAPAATYRRIVKHIKENDMARGALVTTHKLDLYEASKDLFDTFDPYAKLCAEVSCISKREGKLIGHAKDPITSGLALEAFISKDHWHKTDAQVLCFGAGGAAVAISLYLSGLEKPPKKMTIVDISEERLKHLKSIHKKLEPATEFDYVLSQDSLKNDALLESQASQSLIINATGMGKDRPGSPLSDRAEFPEKAVVWELNYRGELDFYHQAKAQEAAKNLQVENGWVYFLHGWTQIIAEVFQVELTLELFKRLDEAAAS
ncbi:MAG: hypothetical protein KC422_05375 [Trueperaceae bacterium]|nr:hypothetical protein [Trueperaceae bacterium]